MAYSGSFLECLWERKKTEFVLLILCFNKVLPRLFDLMMTQRFAFLLRCFFRLLNENLNFFNKFLYTSERNLVFLFSEEVLLSFCSHKLLFRESFHFAVLKLHKKSLNSTFFLFVN